MLTDSYFLIPAVSLILYPSHLQASVLFIFLYPKFSSFFVFPPTRVLPFNISLRHFHLQPSPLSLAIISALPQPVHTTQPPGLPPYTTPT